MLGEECGGGGDDGGDDGSGEVVASFRVAGPYGCSKLIYNFTVKLVVTNKSCYATHTEVHVEGHGK